jgi:two-component system nitrogen regulation sensor histidine kinase NtrY
VRLAPRLILAFGFLAAVSSAGLGVVLREDRRLDETRRFDDEVRSACVRVATEVQRQADADRKLVAGACQAGELVDRALVAIDSGELDERRLALAALVPGEREAFGLDELTLLALLGDAAILGADPRSLLGTPRARLDAALAGDPAKWVLRADDPPAIVSRCVRRSRAASQGVALLGARHLDPLLARFGSTAGVRASLGAPADQAEDSAQARCALVDPGGASIPMAVTKSKAALDENLARIDRTIFLAAIASTGAALLLAVLLARSLGRPIEDFAREVRKVATDQARPLEVSGSGELAELARAFDHMIDDLAITRRRLAAASRIAAWREVARRVAHEVKNPLAPIRAAVETLRRLRARKDPAFDEYFDEATRTVLDEVHRISVIVTEFTRFARLPAPRPTDVDVDDLVRSVVQLQRAAAGERVRIVQQGPRVLPRIRADRDQVVQVLTNLVQNAIDAVKDRGGEITIATAAEAGRVTITVSDDGPGIPAEMAAHLFEPYATTKAHGTGLGLAIAQRIAIEHNGELAYLGASANGASSEAGARARARGHGAVFRVVLPIDGPPPAADATPMPND